MDVSRAFVPWASFACLMGIGAPKLLFPGQENNDRVNAMQVTRADRSIVVTREFAAPRQKVFDALTRPDQVPHWFQPQQMSLLTYEADLRKGGNFRYVFQRPSGKEIEVRGVFQEVVPPRRWVHTEAYDFSALTLLVTTALIEARGRTLLTQNIQYSSNEERDSDFDAVAGSSAGIYVKLDQYLASSK